MPPDKKTPIAKNEAPKAESSRNGEVEQDGPLTKEAFSAQLQRLTESARDAGLKPLQTMAQTYARRVMAMIEGLLSSLEHDDSSKKKEK